MVRPVINSIKHYVQVPIVTVASGATATQGIANAAAAPANTATSDVNIGCLIKAVYAEIWVDGDTSEATVVAIITKRLSGAGAPTFTNMNNLMSWNNKANVFEVHQGLLPDSGNVLPVFRGWIKIPRGKQRFAQGDKLSFALAATGTEVHFCGFFVYKEYQ